MEYLSNTYIRVNQEGKPLSFKGYIAFDFDGTLISSHWAVIECVRLTMQEHFCRSFTFDEVKAKYTTDIYAMNERFGIKSAQEGKKLLDIWAKYAREIENTPRVYPGVIELLDKLSANNYELFIWTGRDRASTLEIAKYNDILKYFTDLRCSTDCAMKPHPQGLHEMLDEFPKEKVIVVGDSQTDMRGAKDFGGVGVGAAWGEFANHDSLRENGAHVILDNVKDCFDCFEKIIGE